MRLTATGLAFPAVQPTEPTGLPATANPTVLDRVRAAADLLEAIVADRGLLAHVPTEDRRRLLAAAALVYHPDPTARRRLVKTTVKLRKADRANRDEAVRADTGIRKLRRQTVFTTPNVFPPAGFSQEDVEDDATARAAAMPHHCYVCKADYSVIHHFYDRLCPPCGDLNFAKRSELADLRGRVALLTGGRVKIGYQAGLKLLRAGARLIVTTRFPRDSAVRYAAEPDFADWSDRLEILGLDLRHSPSVEAMCQELVRTRDRLDFILNNACQTVRRPAGFYRHLMDGETAPTATLPPPVRRLLGPWEEMVASRRVPDPGQAVTRIGPAAGTAVAGLINPALLSQVPLLPDDRVVTEELFPTGRFDQDLQQIDLRDQNSWRLLLADVPSVELIEVQLVNAIAPFIINARLKPLMIRTPERDKHIVNVSAVEGQFYRRNKTTRHPHTNMAKAALNMMTRTSATDYHASGIHMNSVDTGWVTDEDAAPIAERKVANHKFHPPLDIVDGAARIVDPIFVGFNTGEHVWGRFLKDYQVADW